MASRTEPSLWWKRVLRATLLTGLLVAMGATGGSPAMAQGPYPCPGETWQLCPNQSVGESEFIKSQSGWYDFGFFCDSNYQEWCAVIQRFNGSAYWTQWMDYGADLMYMQTDGNLVIYDTDWWTPLWWTGTHLHTGAWLNVQNDGNTVIYDEWGYDQWSVW
jgi:hypothetical protein